MLFFHVRKYVSVTRMNVVVTSRRNVANQRSYVKIIAGKEGGAWERIIINAPQAIDGARARERGR